tara:strand:+ start:813 stop:1046 length:234 start_codon:yes stop_codon:yes gene_type:complete
MRNNATFIDEQQLKLLGQLDKWIVAKDWKADKKTTEETIIRVRTLITKIQKQGYYYEGEADFLNELRSQFLKERKNT